MTSANVTQASGIFFGVAAQPQTSGMGNTADESFSNIMKNTAQNPDKQMQEKSQDVQASKTHVQKVSQSNIREAGPKDEGIAEKQTQNTDKAEIADVSEKDAVTAEEEAAVEEALEDVKEVIEDILGISEEELENIMETLGLTDMSLLNAGNNAALQEIAIAAAGEGDSLSLLTNESLYQNVGKLIEAVGEITANLQETLGTDDMQFRALMQQMESAGMEEEVNAVLPESEMTEGVPREVIAQNKEAEAAVVIPKEEASAVDGEESGQTQDASSSGKIPEGISEKSEESALSGTKAEKSSSQNADAQEGKQEGSNAFLQSFARTGDILLNENNLQSLDETMFRMADTEDVMNQITEFMRLEAKPEMTELELQLQPETLGTINVKLAAKEGAVTAQFTAQNEAVKAVLEAQMAQLKENLNNQGVKVEAVEVAVASHGFDRNLQQEGGQNSHYEEPKRKGVRRIQLDGNISIDEMELEEEERIAAEMMKANGNTVDYTA